jgi:hypothetical protein
MSFRTDRNGNRFPTRPKLTMYYQVMVTHYPEGYEPFTVEYGMAERSLSEAQKKLLQAGRDFPQSKARIDIIRLETGY